MLPGLSGKEPLHNLIAKNPQSFLLQESFEFGNASRPLCLRFWLLPEELWGRDIKGTRLPSP